MDDYYCGKCGIMGTFDRHWPADIVIIGVSFPLAPRHQKQKEQA